MACRITVWDAKSGRKQGYTCDEENVGRIVEDEHARGKTGQYVDTGGKSFSVDWAACRLINFQRELGD